MEWLKDKKNLPIVAALAVFLLLGAGGLVAWELGAFSGSPAVSSAPVTPGVPPIGAAPGLPPGSLPPGRMGAPSRLPPGIPRGVAGAPGGAAVKKPDSVNPAVGPDPFKIPNGTQKAALIASRAAGPKPAIRDAIGPLNLFQIRPPAPPPAPSLPDIESGTGGGTTVAPDLSPRRRFSGVITGTDGINAIVEVDGQSQTVKPGDKLSDGAQVTNIQATTLTLRTADGAVISLPLSAGTPDQGNNSNGPAPFQPGFSPQGQNN